MADIEHNSMLCGTHVNRDKRIPHITANMKIHAGIYEIPVTPCSLYKMLEKD